MSGRREARANGDHHRQGAAGGGSAARSRRDRRFRRALACARRRGAGRRRAVELSPRLFQHPADRSRRGALRAGLQANGGERRLRRHPVPGRGALQEAGRHLLAAGRGGEVRARARVRPRARDHLALPGAVADRRHRGGAADLLDGARLRLAARRGAGGHDDGELRAARPRAAVRQDRCPVAHDRGRRHGRDGARLSFTADAGWRRACGRSARCNARLDDGSGVLDPRCSGRRSPPACC